MAGLIAASFLLATCAQRPARAVFRTPEGSVTVALELARTEGQRARGLMFRTRLDADEGMLFVFESGERASFWMKNTYVRLDLLFLSREGIVLDFYEQLPPCALDPCPSYAAREPAAFALELKAGFIAGHLVRRGDRVGLEIGE